MTFTCNFKLNCEFHCYYRCCVTACVRMLISNISRCVAVEVLAKSFCQGPSRSKLTDIIIFSQLPLNST